MKKDEIILNQAQLLVINKMFQDKGYKTTIDFDDNTITIHRVMIGDLGEDLEIPKKVVSLFFKITHRGKMTDKCIACGLLKAE